MDNVPPNITALAQITQASGSTTTPPAAQVLLELAKGFTLFHTPDGEAYASTWINGRQENWLIRSKPLRMWLIRQFAKDQRKPPPAQALQDVLQVLESQALDSDDRSVFLRVAVASGVSHVDLADEQRRIVAITPGGWRIVDEAPVRFIRPARSHALPGPVPHGSLEPLRELVNVKHEEDWNLLVGWLLGALHSPGPYPILILQGEQGTAKSTVAKILKYLVDPSAALLRTAPREERDLFIAARHSHVLAFDNLSGIHPWFSDALCRLATGGGFATRELYSDTEETLLHAQRPVILNGIDDLAIRHDLIDRAIVITLPTIPENARRQDRTLWEQVTAIRPAVLGALLTALQSAVGTYDRIVLPSLPRMADFAVWVTAAESGLNWKSGTFLRAYRHNRSESNELGFEASPIASHIRALMDSKPRWEGTAKDLLEWIRSELSEVEQRARAMPQTPQAIRNHLKRLAPALRTIQIELIFGQRKARTGQRLITIEKVADQLVTSVTPVTGRPHDDQYERKGTDQTPRGDDGDTGDSTKQALSGRGFPPAIEGLGSLRRDALGRCTHCDDLTCFLYGGTRFCVTHAWLEVQQRQARRLLLKDGR